MKILFLVNPDNPLINGGPIYGSAMQIILLKKNLERKGHYVEISGNANINLNKFNIAHVTMIGFDSTIEQCEKCYENKLPVVIKTLNSWSNEKSQRLNQIASTVSAITVESPIEESLILKRFGENLKNKVYRLLPLVDDQIVNQDISWNIRRYVHINSRYDKNKNHISVVIACKELGLPVITAGDPFDAEVYRKCKSLNYGIILREQNKEALSNIYNKTRVYVCASEKEICSTSICEAIKCGCNVVSSSTNWGNSNYDKDGFYVYQYNNHDDIKEKIIQAYELPRQENRYWTEDKLVDEYLDIFEKHKRKTTPIF